MISANRDPAVSADAFAHDVTSKTRTVLILISIAVTFFIGVIVRHWLW